MAPALRFGIGTPTEVTLNFRLDPASGKLQLQAPAIAADLATPATVRLFRNEQFLGEKRVELSAGKNLFTFPQTLVKPGFYKYDVQVDVPGDPIPQNNRATGFATVELTGSSGTTVQFK